jgi:tRNA pseudouridine38-40 synthase
MRNIKLTVEYEGTNYSGWQTQKSRRQPTIEKTIEEVLEKVLQENVKLIGSGRTDAGVHAKAQVANFKTRSRIELTKLHNALNGITPPDIVVTKIQEVPSGFHARYSAKSKLYRYTILNRKYPNAHLRNFVYFYSSSLDVNLMKRKAKILLGKNDFKSFQSSDKKIRDSLRTIKRIEVKKKGEYIYIDVEADGFLYKMVRNIVGTLIEIGRGRQIDLKKILHLRKRELAGPPAPASGLCLIKVRYK